MKVLIAASGWMLTLTLMAFSAKDNEVTLYAWAVLTAFVACVPTYWLMFDDHRAKMAAIVEEIIARERDVTDEMIQRERIRTEELIVRVAQQFADAELPRLQVHRRA